MCTHALSFHRPLLYAVKDTEKRINGIMCQAISILKAFSCYFLYSNRFLAAFSILASGKTPFELCSICDTRQTRKNRPHFPCTPIPLILMEKHEFRHDSRCSLRLCEMAPFFRFLGPLQAGYLINICRF